MPFSDQQLGEAMQTLLVQHNVMSADQLAGFIANGRTEGDVRNALSAGGSLGNFGTYWTAIGNWLGQNGGNIATLSGNTAQGRTSGNPTGLALKAVYDDAFTQVRSHITNAGFSAAKAVSSQLRFIHQVTPEDDEDDEDA